MHMKKWWISSYVLFKVLNLRIYWNKSKYTLLYILSEIVCTIYKFQVHLPKFGSNSTSCCIIAHQLICFPDHCCYPTHSCWHHESINIHTPLAITAMSTVQWHWWNLAISNIFIRLNSNFRLGKTSLVFVLDFRPVVVLKIDTNCFWSRKDAKANRMLPAVDTLSVCDYSQPQSKDTL
jgi:hypothetical protein